MSAEYKILQITPADGWVAKVKFKGGEIIRFPLVAWALCEVKYDEEIYQNIIAVVCPEGGEPYLIEEAFDNVLTKEYYNEKSNC